MKTFENSKETLKLFVFKRIINLFAAIILLILAFSIGCSPQKKLSTTEKNSWQIVKQDKDKKKGWKLFSRIANGSDFLEFKVEGNIESSPTACIGAVKEKLVNNAKYTDDGLPIEILSETENELLTYSISKMPFLFKNREMCERYVFFKDESGAEGVQWKEAWEECPVPASKKLIRMPIIRGSWTFSPSEANHCQAVYTVQFDPGGKIPAGMVNKMAGNFLIEELESIRELSKGDYSPDWQIIKRNKDKKNGYVLKRRKVEGTKVFEFKIEGPISATPVEALKAVRYTTLDKDYNEENGHNFEILEQTKNEVLIYSYMSAPWPFKDRDVVVRYTFYTDETEKSSKMSWLHEQNEDRKQVDGVIRMPVDIGEWSFVSTGDNECYVTATIRFDPGGNMPGWMINTQVKSFLVKDLNSLREIATSDRLSLLDK